MINPPQEVKKYIHKHACRDIELHYMPGTTTMTAQDEEFLAAYITLYDFQWKMNEWAQKLFKDFIEIDKKLASLREQLASVTDTFDNCSKVADKLSDYTYIPEEANLEKLTECRLQTSAELQDYHAAILEVYEEMVPCQEELDKYFKADEDEANDVHDVYSDISLAHSNNWENNAIDIAAFEFEFEMYHAYKDVHETHRRSLTEMCEKTLNTYAMLNQESTTQVKLWDEFLKRCKLLQLVADLHSRALGGSVN